MRCINKFLSTTWMSEMASHLSEPASQSLFISRNKWSDLELLEGKELVKCVLSGPRGALHSLSSHIVIHIAHAAAKIDWKIPWIVTDGVKGDKGECLKTVLLFFSRHPLKSKEINSQLRWKGALLCTVSLRVKPRHPWDGKELRASFQFCKRDLGLWLCLQDLLRILTRLCPDAKLGTDLRRVAVSFFPITVSFMATVLFKL